MKNPCSIVNWSAECGVAENICVSSDPTSGCDKTSIPCTTCYRADFVSALDMHPTERRPHETVFFLTPAGAVICDPGAAPLQRGDIVTSIAGIAPSKELFVKLREAGAIAMTVDYYRPDTLQSGRLEIARK